MKKFPWQPVGVVVGVLQLLLGLAHANGSHRRPVQICLWCHVD